MNATDDNPRARLGQALAERLRGDVLSYSCDTTTRATIVHVIVETRDPTLSANVELRMRALSLRRELLVKPSDLFVELDIHATNFPDTLGLYDHLLRLNAGHIGRALVALTFAARDLGHDSIADADKAAWFHAHNETFES